MAVLFLEINEATAYFIDKYASAGLLPNLSRVMSEGARIRTRIPDLDREGARYTRDTSPWIVWPSIYTGLRPAVHELVGFGQDTGHLRGKYLWDVLSAAGLGYGVFGSLMSYPPRPEARFFVPESLASDADCVPKSLRSLQQFMLYGAHHYSEPDPARFARAGMDLVRATGSALPLSAAFHAFAQVAIELFKGAPAKADRAMLHSILTYAPFERLYRRTRPDFATVHFNHIAYFQHRYWRAAEPARFRRELSSTDRRFYRGIDARERDEVRYADKIENAYVWTDRMVGRALDLLNAGDTLVIASALGQRPYDPVSEIHNPVVRFERAESFFARLGLENVVVRYEMNPDITIDCVDDARAVSYHATVDGLRWDDGSPVFFCQRRRRQLFLELIVPPRVQHEVGVTIRHRDLPDFVAPAGDHVWQSTSNEQSTAHHDDEGLLLVWRKEHPISVLREEVLITEIAPAVLDIFGIAPQEWHRDYAGPVISA